MGNAIYGDVPALCESMGVDDLGDEVIRMQQEAAQRVQRMQERARRLVAEGPPIDAVQTQQARQPERRTAAAVEAARQARAESPPAKEETKSDISAGQPSACGESEASSSGLAALIGDQDRLFILMLAVLLVRNGAKMDLVLALLYLAM